MAGPDEQVAIVGGGVVGCALAYELACRGVSAVLLEAEAELASCASGSNSGIVHTGFDSKPGELETELILRAGEMRAARSAGPEPLLRCGARLRPTGPGEEQAVAALAENAARNGVPVDRVHGGELWVPGEAVIDPRLYARRLAGAARAAGATVQTSTPVSALAPMSGGVALELDGVGA